MARMELWSLLRFGEVRSQIGAAIVLVVRLG